VEELLFRGTLQQFLKKYFPVKTSIAITALVFACFHYSSAQDLGNFSLIPSLFVFACFLGYTYERQGSIFASIGLHITFNLASSFQILFFPES
jgi:membrane protease YdiL (CAAX protease family)